MVNRPGTTRAERGLAIITVMLVMSILAVIGLGIATMGAGHLNVASSQGRSEKAFLAADAAALYAVDALAAAAPAAGGYTPPAPPTPGTVSLRYLDTVNSPGVAFNSTIYVGPITISAGPASGITVPALHTYIVGRGVVGNGTVNPTERYVGLMCHQSPPSGLYYYGAYAKNNLDASGATAVIDAWTSGMTTQYSSGVRRPYADVVGAGTLTDVSGCTNLYGNADGPTVKTNAATNFNNMGSAISPGTTCTLPTINWPNVAPSPGTVPLNYTGPGTIDIYPDTYSSINVVGGTARLMVPGDYNFSSFKASGSANVIAMDVSSPVGTPGEYKIYVGSGGCNVTGNSNVTTQSKLPRDLQIYYNGNAMTVNGTGDVCAQIVCTNTSGLFALQDTATLTGSIISFNNIKIEDGPQIHYDTSLRATGAGYAGPGAFYVGVKSHERL